MIGPAVVIPILVLCAVVALVIVVLTVYFYCISGPSVPMKNQFYSGFTRRHTFELSCKPAPGVYKFPLEVHLSSSYSEPCDILVDVQYTPLLAVDGDSSTKLMGTDDYYGDHFMLYAAPLLFLETGRYIVHAHTVYPTLRVVGAVHQFSFDIVENNAPKLLASDMEGQEQQLSVNLYRNGGKGSHAIRSVSDFERPLPPRIIPEKGEITTFTPVIISLNEESISPDQIRYSVDGSYPSLLYTGPFKLTTPPFTTGNSNSSASVVVRAIAVSGLEKALVSEIVEAHLVVYAPGHSFLDPNIPAPVARVRALGAELYFDESLRPPQTDIIYQIVYIGEARQKAKFSRRKGVVYDGKPVPLAEDVAFVYAWTFVDDNDRYTNKDARRNVRSSAAVYDCCRAMTWNRELREGAEEGLHHQQPSLPPPCICISCKEMELFFDDPPLGGIICYTLDRTEPVQPDATTTTVHMARIGFNGATSLPHAGEKESNLSTYMYRANQPIHVTLLMTEEVFVTARIFIPVVDPSAAGAVTGYRYGERFYRGFTTQ